MKAAARANQSKCNVERRTRWSAALQAIPTVARVDRSRLPATSARLPAVPRPRLDAAQVGHARRVEQGGERDNNCGNSDGGCEGNARAHALTVGDGKDGTNNTEIKSHSDQGRTQDTSDQVARYNCRQRELSIARSFRGTPGVQRDVRPFVRST